MILAVRTTEKGKSEALAFPEGKLSFLDSVVLGAAANKPVSVHQLSITIDEVVGYTIETDSLVAKLHKFEREDLVTVTRVINSDTRVRVGVEGGVFIHTRLGEVYGINYEAICLALARTRLVIVSEYMRIELI